MFNHAPQNYKCPICVAIKGIESEDTLIRQADIIYQDELVTAFIGSFFIRNNPGHIIIVPNEHYENIYELPENVGHQIFNVAKRSATAIKETRKCDGITTMQNNEPAGNQHAFHYHLHIFPRFENDELHAHLGNSIKSEPGDRLAYSEPLKKYFKKL